MTNEEVIRELENIKIFNYTLMPIEALDIAINAVRQLEQKKGEWIYTSHYGERYRRCKVCGMERKDDRSTGWNFCPYCGSYNGGD